MNPEAVRRFALSLPEASEQPHFAKASFRVRGKIFATLPAVGTHLHVFLAAEDVPGIVALDPASFEELWWGKKLWGVRVSLAAADEDRVQALVREAWRRKAPRRLAARVTEAEGT